MIISMEVFRQLTNASNTELIPSILPSGISDLVAIVAAGIAATALIVTVVFERKNLKMNALNLVFEKLNRPDERKARKAVIVAFYNYLKDTKDKSVQYGPDSFFDEFLKEGHPKHPDLPKAVRDHAERIKNNFEQIAVMEKNGLVDESMYFDAYYGSMLRCYGALEGHIAAFQDNAGSKHFTAYYQEQAKRAVDYWKKHHPKARINYYDTDSNSEEKQENSSIQESTGL